MTNKNYVQKCKDRLLLKSSDSIDSLLFSETGWLSTNGIFDDHAAIFNVSNYIKQNWNLDPKYLFTVEKSDKSINTSSTTHCYKVKLNYYFIKYSKVLSLFDWVKKIWILDLFLGQNCETGWSDFNSVQSKNS